MCFSSTNLNRINDIRTTDGRSICFRCQQPGHHAINCHLPSNRRPNISDNRNSNASFCQNAQQIINQSVELPPHKLMFITVKLRNNKIQSLIDTGSEVTMISKELVTELELPINKYRGKRIHGVNSKPVKIIGETPLEIVVFDKNVEKKIKITALIIENFHLNLLLGYDFHHTARSIIDIYNNSIMFESEDADTNVECNDSYSNKPALIANTFNKMHALEDITIPANGIGFVKCVPSYKKSFSNAYFLLSSNKSILSKQKLYVREQGVTLIKGIATVPVVNLNSKPETITSESIVSDSRFVCYDGRC